MDEELRLKIAKVKAELDLLMFGITPMEKHTILNSFHMTPCETSSPDGDEAHGWDMWCLTHDKPVKHSAGDHIVCEVYANSEGCNCCTKNRYY